MMRQYYSFAVRLFLILLLSVAGCKGGKKSKEDLIQKGQIYENIRQFNDAIAQYDEALKVDPFFVEAYLRKGKCYKELGNYQEAIAVYLKGYVLDTNSVPLIQAIAEVYYLMRDFDNSLAYCQKLQNKNKSDAFALNQIGKVKMAQRDNVEAVKYFRRAVEENPKNSSYVRDLVVFFASQKEFDAALRICDEFLKGDAPEKQLEVSLLKFDLLMALNQLDKALAFISHLDKKKPKNPEILLRLGQYYFAKEDMASALKYSDAALELSPSYAPSLILKGTILLKERKSKEALVLWQSLVRAFPNLPEVQFKLAAAFELNGQYEQAKTAYQRLLQIVPDFLPGQLALAQIYFRDGWHDEVKKICGKVLEKDPNNVDALKISAASLLMQKKYAEAIPIYQKIMSLSPEMEKSHALISELYLANGNFEAAYQEAQKALQQTPKDTRMMLVSGMALRYLGFLPQAQTIFTEILQQDSEYIPARFSLAEIYATQKLWAPAEEQYQKILEKHPDNMEASLRMGKLYFMEGKKDKAEAYFLELVKKYPDQGELSFELGRIYADQKKLPEAIEKFKAVVGLNPNHILGNLLLANLYRQNGNFEEAEKLLRTLLKVRAGLNLENDIALLLIAEGKDADALEFIKSLSVVDQQRTYIMFTKSFAFLLTGQEEEALLVFRRLEEQMKYDLIYAMAYAGAYLLTGQEEKAVETFHAQLTDFKESWGWYENLARSFKSEREKKKALAALDRFLLYSYYQWQAQAEESYQEVLKLFPANPLFQIVKVKGYQQMQNWDAALKLLDELLEKEPSNSFLHFQRGNVLLQKGDINSAIGSLYRALELNPDSILIRINLIQVLKQQRRVAEAEKFCREAVAKFPNRSEPVYLLADIFAQQGRVPEAIDLLKSLVEKKPDEIRAALTLGQLYFNQHKYAECVDILKPVVLRDEKNMEAHSLYLRAVLALDRFQDAEIEITNIKQNLPQLETSVPQIVIYLKQGRLQDALNQAHKVEVANLVNAPSLFVMGLVYEANADAEQAMKYFSLGADKTKDNLLYQLAYLNLAKKQLKPEQFQKEVTARIGDSEGSRDYFQMLDALFKENSNDMAEIYALNMLYLSVLNSWDEQAASDLKERLKNFPKNLFFYRIAFFICDRNHWGERETDLLEAQLKYYPKDEFALMQLARLELSSNKPDTALGLYERVLLINLENEEALVFAGMIYAQKEQHEKAQALYEKALQINPNNVVALNNLSYLYASQPPVDLQKAASLGEKAQKLAPESGAVADTLGWIYYQQGRYAEALVQLQRARQAIPQVAEVRYHLGKTYLQMKDLGNAKQELAEALRLDPKADFVKEVNSLLQSLK